MPTNSKDYRDLSDAKKHEQVTKIPESWRIDAKAFDDVGNVLDVPLACGLLDEAEAKITSDHDATSLLEGLRAGTWSVEQVTVAFCKRAAIAHQLTNCLTEIFFDDAITRARKLDGDFVNKSDKGALPPLFGLPISLKDSFDVAGYDTSTGLGCYVNEPAQRSSALVNVLLDLGAVLYCKTNLPQSIMTPDSDNNVFGRTLNPRNKQLTAGGSTGGEGALLALRGSILGVGTDIAGSIRVPSLCNGLYGFRPCAGLVPHDGVRDLTPPGSQFVRSTAGPLATSLRDCSLFLKVILEAEPWKYDSTSVSVPWANLVPQTKLRIGAVQDDGLFTPSPPMRRGLQQAIESLRASHDIEVVPISLPDLQLHVKGHLDYLTVAGPDWYKEQFARTNEPVIPSLKNIDLLEAPENTLRGLFDLNTGRSAAAETYRELFCSNNLDAILMLPAPHTAVPLDSWTTASYTCLWNYLDYPAIVIPVDQVQPTDFADDLSNAKYGAGDEDVYKLYTGPDQYKDAPICVQIVGYRHRDEALLNAAAVVDSIINRV